MDEGPDPGYEGQRLHAAEALRLAARSHADPRGLQHALSVAIGSTTYWRDIMCRLADLICPSERSIDW